MNEKKGICFEIFSSGVGVCLFGATGDLSKKKLIPSLYNLYAKEYVRENFFVINIGSKDYDEESFREYVSRILKSEGERNYESFLSRNFYFKIDYSDEKSYFNLYKKFLELESRFLNGVKNRLFYLAIPPGFVEKTLLNIKNSFNPEPRNTEIIIEKPYGSNFCEALNLNLFLKKNNLEKCVYRIDHYLGKDSVLNILLVRFLNFAFDKTFNNKFIDNVQITVYEEEGVEDRISFYDSIGAFKDMITHIIQLISFVAMDLPKDMNQSEIKKSKINVLKNIKLFSEKEIKDYFVRGRYLGYENINGVKKDSDTETFVAFKLEIETYRWKGVPFYVKCGKRMKEKMTRVDIVYKNYDNAFSNKYFIENSNILSFIIQPQKIMEFRFNAKSDGPKFCVSAQSWNKHFNTTLLTPSDYERLVLDAINKDKTLFLDSVEMEYIWRYIKHTEDTVLKNKIVLERYEPKKILDSCLKMIEKDKRKWIYV